MEDANANFSMRILRDDQPLPTTRASSTVRGTTTLPPALSAPGVIQDGHVPPSCRRHTPPLYAEPSTWTGTSNPTAHPLEIQRNPGHPPPPPSR